MTIFSKCKTHRYTLTRTWNNELPTLVYICLNPSNANEIDNDQTINKCISIAKSNNFGSICVVNLFSFIATNPIELLNVELRVDDVQVDYIQKIIHKYNNFCLAWGNVVCNKNIKNIAMDRIDFILNLLQENDKNIYCIKRNKSLQPKHPLYCSGGSVLIQLVVGDIGLEPTTFTMST